MNSSKNSLSDIIEIISIVADGLKEPIEDDNENKTKLAKKLIKSGFSLEAIESAMSIFSIVANSSDPIIRLGERRRSDSGKSVSTRFLHEAEALRFNRDSHQMLLDLVETGQISDLHFERALEFILQNDIRDISVPYLKLILYLSLPDAEQQVLASRSILNNMRLN